MKRMKTLVTLLTAALLLGLLGGMFSVQAAEVDSTGPIGDNATWTLYSDGTVVISGTGDTWDYQSASYPLDSTPLRIAQYYKSFELYPDENNSKMTHIRGVMRNGEEVADGGLGTIAYRNEYGLNVKSVVVEDGITSIGSSLFTCLSSCESITLPESIARIGDLAFWNGFDGPTKEQALAAGQTRWSGPIDTTIYGVSGSYAETYAKEKEIDFVAIEPEPEEVPQEEQPQETPQEETPAADVSLVRGMNGEAVAALQQKLADLGYEVGAVDGDFGAMTEAAVTAFQQNNGLWVDGVAGPMTLAALDTAASVQLPEKPAAEDGSGTPAAQEETPDTPSAQEERLAYGSAGTAVLNLQKQLADLGCYTGGLDGDFGAVTEAAVYEFQQNNGLWVDGVAGPQTMGALLSNPIPKYAEAPAEEPVPETSAPEISGGARYLVYGMTGEDVTMVQARLAELGYEIGAVDGYFGDYTYYAVLAFQNDFGLLADGEAGPCTLAALGLQ